MGKSKIIIVAMLALFTSCRQSLYDVLTQNDFGYWLNPHGMIIEYSKKDSLKRYLEEDCSYSFNSSLGDIWGIKFKIKKDTIFHYVEIKKDNFITMYDTLIVESYSKDSIILINGVILYNIPQKVIRNRQKLLKK